MSGSFDELTVVEVAGSPAGGYAGRLFAGWGARVIKAGVGDAASGHEALGRYLDHAKEREAVDRAGLESLVAGADVVIESSGPEPLRPVTESRPGLIRVEISPLGPGGPRSDRWSTELTDQAASGHLLLNGDPDREPVAGPANQVAYAAGLHGFIGAAAALLGGRQGRGSTVEVNHLQVMAALHQFTLIRWLNGGDRLSRMGNRWAGPGRPCGLYQCLDGHVATIVPRDDQLERLLAVTGLVHLLAEPGIEHAYDLMHHPTLLDDHLRPWFASQRVVDAVELLQEVRVAVAPVSSMADLLTDPHLVARETLVEVEGIRLPGPPARIDGIEWRTEPSAEDRAGFDHAGAPGEVESPPRPLDGLRVVDLTRVWAGPLATRVLADLGADVTVVEAPWARGGPTIDEASVRATAYYPDNEPGPEHWNRIGFVNKYALGKKSVALDLGRSEGREALTALLRSADIVIENYSPRVMPQLGFDEAALRDLHPGLTYVTMPGYGRTGPARDRVAYGPVIDSHAGLSVLMGYVGEPVRSAGVAWPDPVAGLHAAAAALVALLARRSDPSGRGRTVEVAQIEATVAMVGGALADYQQSGVEPAAPGNRHPEYTPQVVLPCRGTDRWVALTVVNDEGWDAVCRATGLEAHLGLDLETRRAHQDDIDAALAGWSAGREQAEVVELLASPGVAVALVADAGQVIADPQLAAADAWTATDHPAAGRETWPRTPIRFDGQSLEPRGPAPRLGEHNRALIDDGGIDEEAFELLVADGVVTTRPPD